MRLFPHTWEGLHPAFPSNPSPSESHISVGPPVAHPSLGILSGRSYGLCALACVAAAAGVKPTSSLPAHKTVSFLVKTTVVTATLGAAGSVNHKLGERRAASIFLRSRHIELPPFIWVDRFTSWDADNWSLFGGLAGRLAATRRPCPLPSVSRTLWYAIHMMSGIWIAGWGHAAQEVATMGVKLALHQERHKKPVNMIQRVSYQPEVAREAVLDLLTSAPGALEQVQIGTIKLSPDIVAALKERATSWSFGPRGPVNDSQTLVEQILDYPNYSDGFHKTHKPADSIDPVPYSTRNYNWSRSPQHAGTIYDLEKHITELRKKRQQRSNEAEAVRTWLQQREADFYTQKRKAATDAEIRALKPEQHYLEKLGFWYLSTWMAVSECDWMIAGAADHLAFAKATQQGLDWPPPAQSTTKAPNVKLEHILLMLPRNLKSLQAQKRQLSSLIAQLRKDLSEASKANSPRRAAIEEQIRSYEQILKVWNDGIEAIERVWWDAMEKSETGGGGGGGEESSKDK